MTGNRAWKRNKNRTNKLSVKASIVDHITKVVKGGVEESYGNFGNRAPTREERFKRRVNELKDFEKLEKRRKFRRLAHKFLEYREAMAEIKRK